MAIKAVLFDLGDTLWHFPQLPRAQQIRTETMRRVGGLLQSWGIPLEGDLRFLGRDIRYGVEAADRAYMDQHPESCERPSARRGSEPVETAMVGDTLKADVQAAQAHGMTAIWRPMPKHDRPHEPEQVGDVPADTPATRAETGRALGEFGGGEGVTADCTIYTLAELIDLPIFASK